MRATAPAPPGTPAGYRFHRSAVLPWLLRQSRGGGARPSGGSAVSAIVDPPREGLLNDFAEFARCLELLGVSTLVAVGCDPDSWARDLGRLLKSGWRVERMAILDLFPQTPHVESMALLRR